MQIAMQFSTTQHTPQFDGHQFSPLPIASTSSQALYPAGSVPASSQDPQMLRDAPVLPPQSDDPMYAALPAYRFPAGPSRSGSAPAANSTLPGAQLFGAVRKPVLPVAPDADGLQEDRLHFSRTASPVPSLQMSTSTLSSMNSIDSQVLLKPALPIIAFPNSSLSEYEAENVYPSGMVSQAEPFYHTQPQGLGYHGSPALSDNTPWGSLSPVKVVHTPQLGMPQTPSRYSDYNASHRFDVDYSPANISPTTYLPSSAYVPSSGTFAGPPLSTANIPRSAPSTPLGRQDARFIGKPGWPAAQALVNPFPPLVPQTEPRMRTDYGPPQPSYYQQPAFTNSMSGYYSAGEYERDTSPLYMSVDSTASTAKADQRYIPYARPTKAASSQGKRSPPRTLELNSTTSKKARRTIDASLAGSQGLSYSSESTITDSKPRQQRCKIACAACRKTRLKCKLDKFSYYILQRVAHIHYFLGDGSSPCTSCIEKHLKAHPTASEAEAAATIQAEGTCVYENFVRRRGKGKKTIQKEQQGPRTSQEQESRSGSSEYPDGQMAPLLNQGMHIEGITFRHFNQV